MAVVQGAPPISAATEDRPMFLNIVKAFWPFIAVALFFGGWYITALAESTELMLLVFGLFCGAIGYSIGRDGDD